MSIRWCDLPAGAQVEWTSTSCFYFKLDRSKWSCTYTSINDGKTCVGFANKGHMNTKGPILEYEKTLTFLPVELLL